MSKANKNKAQALYIIQGKFYTFFTFDPHMRICRFTRPLNERQD